MKQRITCNGNNDKRNVGIIRFFFLKKSYFKKKELFVKLIVFEKVCNFF